MKKTRCGPGLLVLKWAIYGAAVLDGLIVIDNLMYALWRSGHFSNYWHDFFSGFFILLAIPSAALSGAIGFKGVH